MIDTHCHIKRDGLTSQSDMSPQWSGGIFFGTHPSVDWDLIDELADSKSPMVRGFGYGIHPWFVPTASVGEPSPQSCSCGVADIDQQVMLAKWSSESLLEALEQRLMAHPHAWVGEIGLDKIRPADRSMQEELFVRQLQLASKYRRGASVHCVRAFGPLLDVLTKLSKSQFPPAIVLHGFTGSPEFVTSLMKLPRVKSNRIFFGVGVATTFRLKNFDAVLSTIPSSRILFETDKHWNLVQTSEGSMPVLERETDAHDALTLQLPSMTTLGSNFEALMLDLLNS